MSYNKKLSTLLVPIFFGNLSQIYSSGMKKMKRFLNLNQTETDRIDFVVVNLFSNRSLNQQTT